MKKILYLCPLLFLAGCFFSHKADLPSFNLLMVDSSTIFNTRDIMKGKPSILIFFSPDCEHCQAETASILKNMDSLKEVHFYFITIEPMDRMKVFNGYYQLSRYPNITVGRDYGFFFPGYLKAAAPPYSAIYDKYKRLRAVFKGETAASELIAVINKIY